MLNSACIIQSKMWYINVAVCESGKMLKSVLIVSQ